MLYILISFWYPHFFFLPTNPLACNWELLPPPFYLLVTANCPFAPFTRIKPTTLCSAIDKENSIESLLDLLHYIYNYCYDYASCLPQSLCLSADFFVICCDYDCCHTFVTLWLVMWYFPCSTLVIKEKKRKRKEILNNNLAILPSHDNMEEDCVEGEENRLHREQKTTVGDIGDQVCPVKVKWVQGETQMQ